MVPNATRKKQSGNMKSYRRLVADAKLQRSTPKSKIQNQHCVPINAIQRWPVTSGDMRPKLTTRTYACGCFFDEDKDDIGQAEIKQEL